MKYLNFLALLITLSCSNGEVRKDIEDSPYQTSGMEKYFLPELPSWANYSSAGQCFKTSSLHYLDFPKLASTYQLSYVQLIELQAQYNERLEAYFRSTSQRFLKPVEESAFFSNTLEQVRGGIRSLKIPPVSKVKMIWVDDLIYAKKISEFKQKLKSGRYDDDPAVLFSMCFTRQGLEQWLSENNLEDAGLYMITSEWLSPFNSELKTLPGLSLEMNKILNKDVKISVEKPYKLSLPPGITF